MRKSLLIIYFLVGILLTTFSQDQKIFHSAVTLNHDFNILNHKTNHHICNHFLKEIARGNLKNVEDVTYTIRYTRIIDIYRIGAEDAIVEVTYKPGEISGAFIFRDFDISDWLYPARVELVMEYSTNGNNHNRRIHFDEVPFGETLVSKRISLRSDQTKLFAEVKGQSFLYSTNEQNRFDNRIAAIDDYFASSAILDTALNLLYKNDLQDREDLITTFFDILETGNIIDHLKGKNIDKSLDLKRFDPLGYQRTLAILKYRHSSLLEDYFNKLDRRNDVKSRNGIKNAVSQYTGHYTKYFDLSNELNFYSGSTYYPLGQVIINNQILAKYSSGVDLLVQRLAGNRKSGNLTYLFTHHLYNEWIDIAGKYLKEERFGEAAIVLENAKGLCDYLPYIHCSEELLQYTSQSKQGIFDSYLRIAEKGLLANQPEISENYLVKAYKLQENNSAYILSNAKIKNMLDELMDIYFHLIDVDINSGYFEDALTKLERTQNLDQVYFNLAHIDKISDRKKVAQQGFYDEMIRNTIVYLELENFPGADHQLSEAKNYQALYGNTILPSYLIDSIDLVLEQNEAYLLPDPIIVLIPEETLTIKPYKRPVKQQKAKESSSTNCHQYQLSYYKLYLETKKTLDEEAYLSGGDLFDELRRYNDDDTTCFLKKKDLTNLTLTYQAIIDYSRRARDLRWIMQEKSYNLIPGVLEELDALYLAANTSESEIKKVKLDDLCYEYDDKDLYVYSINYYSNLDENLISLSLIRALKGMNISEMELETLQTAIAVELSGSDYQENPENDPKKQVEKYTRGDKWLSTFKKEYLRNWGK